MKKLIKRWPPKTSFMKSPLFVKNIFLLQKKGYEIRETSTPPIWFFSLKKILFYKGWLPLAVNVFSWHYWWQLWISWGGWGVTWTRTMIVWIWRLWPCHEMMMASWVDRYIMIMIITIYIMIIMVWRAGLVMKCYRNSVKPSIPTAREIHSIPWRRKLIHHCYF